jgi:hypothetical protein
MPFAQEIKKYFNGDPTYSIYTKSCIEVKRNEKAIEYKFICLTVT